MSMLGTVGPPVPYVEARLESVPEMGYDALSSETPRGEICIRGDTLFSGYYKRDDLTKEVLVDGWFHTGTDLSSSIWSKDDQIFYPKKRRKECRPRLHHCRSICVVLLHNCQQIYGMHSTPRRPIIFLKVTVIQLIHGKIFEISTIPNIFYNFICSLSNVTIYCRRYWWVAAWREHEDHWPQEEHLQALTGRVCCSRESGEHLWSDSWCWFGTAENYLTYAPWVFCSKLFRNTLECPD